MRSDAVPVFLNGHPVEMPPGSTLRELLACADPDLGAALALGAAQATDGRGLPVTADTPLAAGAIFRVFRSARTGAGSAADD